MPIWVLTQLGMRVVVVPEVGARMGECKSTAELVPAEAALRALA